MKILLRVRLRHLANLPAVTSTTVAVEDSNIFRALLPAWLRWSYGYGIHCSVLGHICCSRDSRPLGGRAGGRAGGQDDRQKSALVGTSATGTIFCGIAVGAS